MDVIVDSRLEYLYIYEGERVLSKDNHFLDKLPVPSTASSTKRVSLEVMFDLDANGILHVTATDKSSFQRTSVVITNDKGRLSKEMIELMIKQAELYKAEDALSTYIATTMETELASDEEVDSDVKTLSLVTLALRKSNKQYLHSLSGILKNAWNLPSFYLDAFYFLVEANMLDVGVRYV
jgi:molecular chaperone DnaK (HSP70)